MKLSYEVTPSVKGSYLEEVMFGEYLSKYIQFLSGADAAEPKFQGGFCTLLASGQISAGNSGFAC